ncbi:MAG: signal peptidase I [Oscillospiraceae bacterium]
MDINNKNKNSTSTTYKVFEMFKTICVYVLSIAIVIGAILFATDKNPQKSLFGYRYYTVLTNSMEPTLSTGDIVIVKLANAVDINVGDVITFNPSNESDAYLTHRVVEKVSNYQDTGVTCFKTQGDANDTEDGFLIDSSRVVGTVCFSIPKLGYVIRFVQLKWYFVVPLIIMLFVLFNLIEYYFSLQSKDDTPSVDEQSKT